jgi:hypothetical protein
VGTGEVTSECYVFGSAQFELCACQTLKYTCIEEAYIDGLFAPMGAYASTQA